MKAYEYKLTDQEATDWEKPGPERNYPHREGIKAKAVAAAKKAGAGMVQLYRQSGFLVDSWGI